MSRSIKFAKAGGPDVLEFVETAVPAPGPGEVRIKVKAIGINRAEAMWRQDDYIEPVKFPTGLGYEAAVSSMPWAGTSPASPSAMRSTPSRPSR
jgi:NADPH:quinone reductase-like Zn-dependent oxidoreductase